MDELVRLQTELGREILDDDRRTNDDDLVLELLSGERGIIRPRARALPRAWPRRGAGVAAAAGVAGIAAGAGATAAAGFDAASAAAFSCSIMRRSEAVSVGPFGGFGADSSTAGVGAAATGAAGAGATAFAGASFAGAGAAVSRRGRLGRLRALRRLGRLGFGLPRGSRRFRLLGRRGCGSHVGFVLGFLLGFFFWHVTGLKLALRTLQVCAFL